MTTYKIPFSATSTYPDLNVSEVIYPGGDEGVLISLSEEYKDTFLCFECGKPLYIPETMDRLSAKCPVCGRKLIFQAEEPEQE